MFLHTHVTSTIKKPPEEQRVPQGRARARDHALAFLAVCGAVGPVCFSAAMIVAGLLYPGYNQLTQASSELGSRGAPPAAAAVMNYGECLSTASA